jgi:hypothetical protein
MLTEEQFLERCQALGIRVNLQGKGSYREGSQRGTENSCNTTAPQPSAPISSNLRSDIPPPNMGMGKDLL